MSTFDCQGKNVITRKEHKCLLCKRTIPKERKVRLLPGGRYEGDWQNWYACGYCEDEVLSLLEIGESIGDDDFSSHVFDLEEAKCPKCNKKYLISFDIPGDSDTITFKCSACGSEWTHVIYGVTCDKPKTIEQMQEETS